ncbi:MAG: winged helix-turn-helix transcriptional regulator [Sphingomonadaceae bacterium]
MSRFDESLPRQQSELLATLARQVQEGGKRRYEYLRGIFSLLGDKWSIIILLVLATGEMRHAALRRTLDQVLRFEKISQRMLTLKLRAFEDNGVVERQVSDDVPPRVMYRLTDRGHRIALEVFRMIEALEQD